MGGVEWKEKTKVGLGRAHCVNAFYSFSSRPWYKTALIPFNHLPLLESPASRVYKWQNLL